jgi:hypothetical protein
MLDERTVRVVTTSVNGEPAGPYVYDYRTEELTEQLYRYTSIQRGVLFTSHRVDADFDFRKCDLTS